MIEEILTNILFITGVVAVLFPSVIILIYFIYKDLFVEPFRVIFITLFLGAIGVLPMLLISMWYNYNLSPISNSVFIESFIKSFIFVAFFQEGIKFLILNKYSMKNKAFDETMDGVVYGVSASIGLATIENGFMTLLWGLDTGVIRAILLIPANAALGVIMGIEIGKAKMEKENKASHLKKSLTMPIIFHTLFDFPITLTNNIAIEGGDISYTPVAVGFSISFVVLVYICLRAIKISNLLQREQYSKLSTKKQKNNQLKTLDK